MGMRYIRRVRELLRHHLRFFIIAASAAVVLRLFFVFRFSRITTDSFIYGDIAKNWLQHGVYGISGPTGPIPTYIRLPGYPAFLAAIFAIVGVDHYRAALLTQVVIDLATCFVVADLARRSLSARAARVAFLLTALCPFLANYVATALTETLEIFFTALALDFAVTGLSQLRSGRLRQWLGCGLAIAAAILLRPDGGILLASIGFFLLVLLFHPALVSSSAGAVRRSHIAAAGLIMSVCALAPLIPWTVRNLSTMHRFQPLAPRYANEENEFVPVGFNRWVKTWIADYASVEEIYWAVPGDEVDPSKLPDRAFDSPAQRADTLQLLNDYNRELHVSPKLDQRFAALAAQRIHDSPLRYYLWLPVVRIADMWLRPRTELLPSDTRWWEFNDDPLWSVVAVSLGVINLFYVCAAIGGLFRWRWSAQLALLIGFVVLRSAFLGSLENPEPRYTLECYPVAIVLASALFERSRSDRKRAVPAIRASAK